MDDLTRWIGEHVTRGGHKAAVTHTDGVPGYPLVGWRFTAGGYRTAATWTKDGQFTRDIRRGDHDLMPPAPKIVVSEALRAGLHLLCGSENMAEIIIAGWLRETSPEDVAAIHAAVREGRL